MRAGIVTFSQHTLPHACREELAGVDVIAVGLQEVEMGTSSVTRAAIVGAMARGNAAAETLTAHGARWACLLYTSPSPRD